MTNIFLGKPPANIEAWIKEHAAPAGHAETWYKYAGDTEWRTVMLGGTIALVDDMEETTGQIENPYDIVAIEIGTGTQANPVTSVGDYAFYYCTWLTSVTIPDCVTSIGNSAFYGCSRLTSVTISDSVTNIGDTAFSGCHGLTSVTIGSGVTSIGNTAFANCTNLTIVNLPDRLMSIGDWAFNDCGELTSVTIPNSVTSIGNSAFGGCSGLTSVTINCFDVSTTKSLITNNLIFGEAFFDPETGNTIEKTFLVTCTNGSFNVTFGADYSITFQDL